MLFEIVHRTDYRYGHAASEACLEARLTPPTLPTQRILSHRLEFQPIGGTTSYTDYFGNEVTFLSMARRHDRLSVINSLRVMTTPSPPPATALSVTVAEARQILASRLTDVFDYLQPTCAVPTGGAFATRWATRLLASKMTLGAALLELNEQVHKKFEYRPGATEISTPLAEVWKRKEGVCQDFAHVMLSILRTAGMPSRYVCGYIESDPPAGRGALVGAIATHAWVEVMVPGMEWVGYDPTNNQHSGERHVAVSYGRDFEDATPVRGTFKGSGQQRMKVKVMMRRISK